MEFIENLENLPIPWIFTHEAALIFYGVILWQIEQQITKPKTFRARLGAMWSTMTWAIWFVVLDDEFLELVQDHWDIDLTDMNGNLEWYYYSIIGFCTDIIRNRYVKNKEV